MITPFRRRLFRRRFHHHPPAPSPRSRLPGRPGL